MTKRNVRLIREKSIVIYMWYQLFPQSQWRKKKRQEKRQEKQTFFSIIEITVRDIFSTLNSYWTKKSTDMFEKYMGKRMGKSQKDKTRCKSLHVQS